MIVIPCESGLPSRLHKPSADLIQDQTEDDIHQCGACKKQFTDIFLFMRHKSESNCSSRPGKKSTKVTVPTSLLTGGKNTFLAGASTCIIHPETNYTVSGLLDEKSLINQKNDLKLVCDRNLPSFSSFHPTPLVINGNENQNFDSQNVDATSADGKVTLQNNWDSPWSAAKVLGLTTSLKQLQNLSSISDTERPGHIEGITSENSNTHNRRKLQGNNLLSCEDSSSLTIPNDILLDDDIGLFEDDQIVEQFAGSPGVVLDVDDPEVARLLSTHLANDTSLDIYPNTPEMLLACNSSQDDLDIQEIVGKLTFQNDAEFERKIDAGLKIPDSKTKAKIKKPPKPRPAPKGPKLYKCPSAGCDFNSVSTRDLARHQRTHSGEKPFKCSECDKGFTRPDHLQVHMRTHGELKQIFECKLCDYTSKYQTGLVQHMRSHTNERRFRCPICNHSSRTKPHLNVHMKKHTGNNPFRCGFCRKNYTNVTELAEHMKKHSGEGEKSFSCQSCHLFCYFQSSLMAHIAINHNIDMELVCPICKIVCDTCTDFQNHCKTHQDEPKQCKLCDVTFSASTAFNEHLKLHGSEKEKQIPLSSSQMKNKSLYKKIKNVTAAVPKTYNCKYCPETFYLQEAVVVHIQQHQLEELASEPVLTLRLNDENSMDIPGEKRKPACKTHEENMSAEKQLSKRSDQHSTDVLSSLNPLLCAPPSPLGILHDNDNDTTLLSL